MRGYVYWRLLSADPQAANQVILCERPEIGSDPGELEPALMDTLMDNIAMLSSVYHRPPETFVSKLSDIETGKEAEEEEEEEEESEEESEEEEYEPNPNPNPNPNWRVRRRNMSLLQE